MLHSKPLDEEAEPLHSHFQTKNSNNSTSPSWKRFGLAAAVLALLGYIAVQSSTSNEIGNVQELDVLGHNHDKCRGKKCGKSGKGMKSGKDDDDEDETELFDERREYRDYLNSTCLFELIFKLLMMCFFVIKYLRPLYCTRLRFSLHFLQFPPRCCRSFW